MKTVIFILSMSIFVSGCSASSYLEAFDEEMPLAVQQEREL